MTKYKFTKNNSVQKPLKYMYDIVIYDIFLKNIFILNIKYLKLYVFLNRF